MLFLNGYRKRVPRHVFPLYHLPNTPVFVRIRERSDQFIRAQVSRLILPGVARFVTSGCIGREVEFAVDLVDHRSLPPACWWQTVKPFDQLMALEPSAIYLLLSSNISYLTIPISGCHYSNTVAIKCNRFRDRRSYFFNQPKIALTVISRFV